MFSKTILIAAMVAYAEARFGQEQETQALISAVQGGDAGQAATIAGASISDLLGAASACDKLATADQIVADLGGGQDAIDAAIAHVAAEKNTNPSANGNAQKVCADPSLPATEALRGITPLIDPAVDVNGDVAALSASTQASPLDATGLSVFDLLVDAGFGDLVVADGGAGAGNNANQGNANQGNANQGNANQGNANQGNANQGNANQGNNTAVDQAGDAVDCNDGADDAVDDGQANAGNGNANNDQGNAGNGNANNGNANNGNANNGNANNGQADAGNNNNAAGGAAGAAGGAADFGLCTPTIVFEAGVNNRAADEFTFQIGDELARGGQGEALNPAIITNALCNQLTNVCEANEAAITACRDAETQALALGTRDKAVADTFNTAIGFDGAVTNPSGGPADVTDLKKRGMLARKFKA